MSVRRLPLRLIHPAMFIAGVVLLASAARADQVVLENGGHFTGVITYLSEKVVTIKSNGTEWTFERSKVTSLQKEETGREQEAQNDRDRRFAMSHASKSQVVVYGTTWCGFCKKARQYFTARGIPFVDKDVEKDTGAREEVSRKCAAAGFRFTGGVPVIDVHGHILRGFSPEDVEWALKNRSG